MTIMTEKILTIGYMVVILTIITIKATGKSKLIREFIADRVISIQKNIKKDQEQLRGPDRWLILIMIFSRHQTMKTISLKYWLLYLKNLVIISLIFLIKLLNQKMQNHSLFMGISMSNEARKSRL